MDKLRYKHCLMHSRKMKTFPTKLVRGQKTFSTQQIRNTNKEVQQHSEESIELIILETKVRNPETIYHYHESLSFYLILFLATGFKSFSKVGLVFLSTIVSKQIELFVAK